MGLHLEDLTLLGLVMVHQAMVETQLVVVMERPVAVEVL